ncbi:MAG TPA: hypothetical protein VK151_03765 [Fluviicola sp.]|nr:hypothetical protein [Fluviicola sp.]
MKKTVAVWTLSALFSMAFLTACSSSSEKLDEAKEEVTEANEKLEEAQETYLSDIEEYKKETAAKIAANEQMIDDLEKANSVQYKGKVAELKAENELMKIKMDNYKAQGDDQWEEFKTEFNNDMIELGQELNEMATNHKGE